MFFTDEISVTLLNSGISTLLGVSSASVLSCAIGKNDQNTIDRSMGNLIMGVSVLSLIITAGGLIFTKQLLSLTAADEKCMELAVRYLRIIFVDSLFINFAQAANMVMQMVQQTLCTVWRRIGAAEIGRPFWPQH